jgi:hypothetical protein
LGQQIVDKAGSLEYGLKTAMKHNHCAKVKHKKKQRNGDNTRTRTHGARGRPKWWDSVNKPSGAAAS